MKTCGGVGIAPSVLTSELNECGKLHDPAPLPLEKEPPRANERKLGVSLDAVDKRKILHCWK
jgi:hypothetical protein